MLTDLNRIAIAEVCLYAPALGVSIFVATRHGFGRNAGWLYLILFSIIRLLGAILSLATIGNPTNVSLYVAAAILQNIGLSPLILTLLALLGRLWTSALRAAPPPGYGGGQGAATQIRLFHGQGIVSPRRLRLVQTLVLAGLILGIIGGSRQASAISDYVRGRGTTKPPTPNAESVAGLALMVAGFGILVLLGAAIGPDAMRWAEKGERRIGLAIALSLPFMLVRVVYSCMGTFANDARFQATPGRASSIAFLAGMSVAMELAVVAILLAVGVTLHKAPGRYPPPPAPGHPHPDPPTGHPMPPYPHQPPNHPPPSHPHPPQTQYYQEQTTAGGAKYGGHA